MTLPNDPFPSSDFDSWAETYDQSIRDYTDFPFAGYDKVLEIIISLSVPRLGMSILDLGTGTANLAMLFAQKGCDVWCTDFSPLMLAKAREKLPQAHFVLHDLRGAWPIDLERRFDAIVSAYVFHHFELGHKLRICREIIHERLAPGGTLVLGDISFPSFAAKEIFRQNIPDWEEEFYWLADEAVAELQKAGLTVNYTQVSACAGVYQIQ
jgi:putative AdoMet-dependent methyltransferase